MSDINKILDKDKILDWVYNGNATGFTIGEFTSLINMGYFNFTNSLITTIESQNTIINQQQEAIKYWQNDSKLSADCSSRKEAFINSQKEEMLECIRRDQAERHELFLQIQSLKAITELAVKGLKQIVDENISFPRLIARETISEIERLSHE